MAEPTPGSAPDARAAATRRAAEVLQRARSVVVTGHIDPDGDALGSLLALTAGLRDIGVDAVACWGARSAGEDPAPIRQSWRPLLPALAHIREASALPPQPDVLLACDTAAAARLGTLASLVDAAGCTVVVDHHAVGDGFGDVRLVDATASSTGVLALGLLDALGVGLTPAIANALYLAILTDTGRFGFAATSPADHHAAARLLEAGADQVAVARAVYEHASPGYLPLVGRVMGRVAVDDTAAVCWVTQQDLADTGAGWDETDGLLDLLRKVAGPDVAVLLRESPSGRWRTSLRSRGATDVAEVAGTFGGGGHRLAAGCTLDGSVEDVVASLRRRLERQQVPA